MKNKKFLIIYGIIIFIGLLIIVLAPNKWFSKKLPSDQIVNIPEKVIDLEGQYTRLRNNKYEYHYLIMYDINGDQSTYKCNGTIDGDNESGSCSSPSNVTYTDKDKKDVFKKIKYEYLDLNYLLDLIKDIKPTEKKYDNTYLYIYTLNLDNTKTDISIYSDGDNIIEIEIANKYGAYVIRLSNVS